MIVKKRKKLSGNTAKKIKHISMKKIILFALFFTCTFLVHAQSILGIKVGSSFDVAKNTLEARFGYQLIKDKGNLSIYDFYMGDFHFDSGTLYFQWEGKTSRLYSADFQTWDSTSNSEAIKKRRDFLKTIIESKYNIYEFKNKQGFLCYEFLGEEVDGITMHGEINLHRGKGKDGTERLHLVLYYYPIADFIDENSDF